MHDPDDQDIANKTKDTNWNGSEEQDTVQVFNHVVCSRILSLSSSSIPFKNSEIVMPFFLLNYSFLTEESNTAVKNLLRYL